MTIIKGGNEVGIESFAFWLSSFSSFFTMTDGYSQVLILILTASHLASTPARFTPARFWLNEVNKTTSSAKSRDAILWLLNQTLYGPWFYPWKQWTEQVPQSNMHCWTQAPIPMHWEPVDLLLAMQTRHLLRSYTAILQHLNLYSKKTPYENFLHFAPPANNSFLSPSKQYGAFNVLNLVAPQFYSSDEVTLSWTFRSFLINLQSKSCFIWA